MGACWVDLWVPVVASLELLALHLAVAIPSRVWSPALQAGLGSLSMRHSKLLRIDVVWTLLNSQPLFNTMAPRKRSRQDSAAPSSAPAARTSRIDETYSAELARHLAGLRKLRRFTDLKV